MLFSRNIFQLITNPYLSAFQILREIKVSKSGATKIAILTHLEAMKSDFYDLLHLVKVEMDRKIKIQSLQN